jgi:uncharacterized RDD family membrane protein YckC
MTTDSNPYLPPKGHVPIPQDNQAIIPASKGRRFGTFVVDYALYLGFAVCVGVFIGLVFGVEGVQAIQQIPELLLGMVMLAIYYIFFEGLWARTPGKFLFGTVVVNESGGRPSFKQVIGRTLCRFIPFEAFSFFGDRGLHDSIPKTRVVMARRSLQ